MSANPEPATPQTAVPPVQPAAEAVDVAALKSELDKVKAFADKVKGENAKFREQIRAAKAPQPQDDPAAAAKAEAERSLRTERALYKSLIGRVPDADAADIVVGAVLRGGSVTLADDGTLDGLDDVLPKYLKYFQPPAAAPQPVPAAPTLVPPNSTEPIDPKFAGVKSLDDLKQPAVFAEFVGKYPARFAELQAADRLSKLKR